MTALLAAAARYPCLSPVGNADLWRNSIPDADKADQPTVMEDFESHSCCRQGRSTVYPSARWQAEVWRVFDSALVPRTGRRAASNANEVRLPRQCRKRRLPRSILGVETAEADGA